METGGIEDRIKPEFYVCGNPPYKGSQSQTEEQKEDLRSAFSGSDLSVGSADYVLGWFTKAASFARLTQAAFAFVTTNSIHQGRQVARFWPHILASDLEVFFAEPSFRWTNLASNKAVVTVSVIGIREKTPGSKRIFDSGLERLVRSIGPYLVPDTDVVVEERRTPLSKLATMSFGSMPNDGGALLLSFQEAERAIKENQVARDFIRPVSGTEEFINGVERRCIWVTKRPFPARLLMHSLLLAFVPWKRSAKRAHGIQRQNWPRFLTALAKFVNEAMKRLLSFQKPPLRPGHIFQLTCFRKATLSPKRSEFFDGPLWHLAVVASRLHLVWVATVCGKMKTDYRYSNTLGWNTFPLPALTETNRRDLTQCAEAILLARSEHFPSTIADLYDANEMPEDLRRAHESNDEILERIYIGRRFRNDTERLEKLFDLYTKMTASGATDKEESRRGAHDD